MPDLRDLTIEPMQMSVTDIPEDPRGLVRKLPMAVLGLLAPTRRHLPTSATPCFSIC